MFTCRLFCLMTMATLFPRNCFGSWRKSKTVELPGGSWVNSSKQVQVTHVIKEGTGNDDDEEFKVNVLSAKLRNRSHKWISATTLFRKGDKFANKDGTFVPQDRYDHEIDEMKHVESDISFLGKWALLDFIIVNIPWGNFLWISMLRAKMKEMKSDRKAQQQEISKLQKDLTQALIDKDILQRELDHALKQKKEISTKFWRSR